jgi:hypothetical protein
MIVAMFQWDAARRSANAAQSSADVAKLIFEVGNRPYVGIDLLGCQKNESTGNLDVQADIKNFGTALAEDCDIGWTIYLNGVERPGTGFPVRPAVLFPGKKLHLLATFFEPHCSAILSGKSTLEIAVHFLYRWNPEKSHAYEDKYRYEHTQWRFITFGPIARDSKP